MFEDLTNIQIRILNFIKSEVTRRGYPPSVREIGSAVGLASTSSVYHQLSNLEKKGYLKRDPQKPRAMEIIGSGFDGLLANKYNLIDVPVIGKVTAGEPILAYENYEGSFPLPSSFLGGAESFMLIVKGSSMINAGIMDGDYVIVKIQHAAENGDIVVALLEDEATVKTFYLEDDRIRLQPENPMMAPIFTKNVNILGKVIGVIRRM